MWIAERMAIKSNSDEHAAMAYQKFGTFRTRSIARIALIEAVEAEIAGWHNLGMPSGADRDGKVLELLQTTDDDRVEIGNVRWQVREF